MFNTLVNSDFQTKTNCVLVHSKGRPSHGTKAFVKFFNQNFPQVPIHGVGYCNPSGISILSHYFHSANRGFQFSVRVEWLGMRPSQIDDIGMFYLQEI